MTLFTRLSFFLFSIFFLLSSPPAVRAQEQPQRVVIINQVRGEECCEPGSLDTLRSFVTTLQQRELSATFTIRYDALKDQRFISELRKLSTRQQSSQPQPKADPPLAETSQLPSQPTYELGIFLEITPTLAYESGVEYQGNTADWYRAQYAYLIGYDPVDRKKIIDQIFGTFRQQFGYYPTTTTAWMIDTDSLNYIAEKYGATVHQITREQWGTDSYTLSGGPVHYPYLADKSWAFLPTTQSQRKADSPLAETDQLGNQSTKRLSTRPTLILRQTISDPLRNYGDSSSAFTSQPNDYLIDQKTTEYFKKLLLQSLSQPQNQYSFALIGLENSMREEVNQEYLRQLEFVATLVNERPHLKVHTAQQFDQEYRQNWRDQTITSIHGKDLIDQTPHQTIWVNTPHYRVRLLQKDTTLSITDFRLFQPVNQPSNESTHQPPVQLLTDPYNDTVAQDQGYWITPFMLDGSRFYTTDSDLPLTAVQKLKEKLKENLLPEYRYKEEVLLPSRSDLSVQPISLQLSAVDPQSFSIHSDPQTDAVIVRYLQPDNHQLSLEFTRTNFIVNAHQIATRMHLPDLSGTLPFIRVRKKVWTQTMSWRDPNEKNHLLFSLTSNCRSTNECWLTPHVSEILRWKETQHHFYPYLFPDITLQLFDSSRSTMYAHNRVALAGQNPVRLVLLPRDKNGYPVKKPDDMSVTVDPPISEIITQPQHGQLGTTFIDLVENRAGKHQVRVKIADETIYDQAIFFLPDCQQTVWSCLIHPQFLRGYAEYQFITRLRQL